MKILISGGGTGGHVFPGIAIAQALQSIKPEVEIGFVGTQTGAEGKIVPNHGYILHPIEIAGFSRSNWKKNITFPWKLAKGFWDSYQILKNVDPDAVVATGGYVCGPVTQLAQWAGIPTFVQEQNAVPGFTSKKLGKKSTRLYITYEESRSYFSDVNPEKIFCLGNPVRLTFNPLDKKAALKHFGLSEKNKTVLIIGGSTGARSVNQAVQGIYEEWLKEGINLIWQTGKTGEDLPELALTDLGRIYRSVFITEMNLAYQAADLVISRAGATSLAEITLVGKPSVLVPFPFAADDHQTRNARVMENAGAAILIKDSELKLHLKETVTGLLKNQTKLTEMTEEAKRLAKPKAAHSIAEDIIKQITG